MYPQQEDEKKCKCDEVNEEFDRPIVPTNEQKQKLFIVALQAANKALLLNNEQKDHAIAKLEQRLRMKQATINVMLREASGLHDIANNFQVVVNQLTLALENMKQEQLAQKEKELKMIHKFAIQLTVAKAEHRLASKLVDSIEARHQKQIDDFKESCKKLIREIVNEYEKEYNRIQQQLYCYQRYSELKTYYKSDKKDFILNYNNLPHFFYN